MKALYVLFVNKLLCKLQLRLFKVDKICNENLVFLSIDVENNRLKRLVV